MKAKLKLRVYNMSFVVIKGLYKEEKSFATKNLSISRP